MQVGLSLTLPYFSARIIDKGIQENSSSTIALIGIIMFIFSLIQLTLSILSIFLSSRISLQLGRHIRQEVFSHIQNFSFQEQHIFGSASLITRSTNDVTHVHMTTMMLLTAAVSAPIMGIGGIIMALHENMTLASLLIIGVPLLALIVFFVMRSLLPLQKQQQDQLDNASSLLREDIMGIRVIRAFRRERTQKDKFLDANTQLRATSTKISTLWAFLMPATSLVVSLTSVGIVWIGAHEIDKHHMNIGSLTAFISYLMMILGAVMMSGFVMLSIPTANVSAARIEEVITTPLLISSSSSARALPSGTYGFRFNNVSFQQDKAEQPILSNISFSLIPGTTTALIGPTGSGKSTITRLVSRLLDPTNGCIELFSLDSPHYKASDIRTHSLDAIRSLIAYCPQDPYLFKGSIASNVCSFIDVDNTHRLDQETEERVIHALKISEAWEFVSHLDKNIYSDLVSEGHNLSGGQKARISIARAIYRCLPHPRSHSASLLILDDAFSALDFITDSKVRSHIAKELPHLSLLVVASRISTIQHADNILVLNNGQIESQGAHQELLNNSSLYRDIAHSQHYKYIKEEY